MNAGSPENGLVAGGREARSAASGQAFTLLELLVVIAIMGLVAAMTIPSLKGFRQSNALGTANRQLMDDLGWARQRAINERTTVYVLFMPPGADRPNQAALARNGYALYVERSVGDQPGRWTRRYLTDWQSLPDSVVIPTNKFEAVYSFDRVVGGGPPETIEVAPFQRADFPYPKAESATSYSFPYVAFSPQGGLVPPDGVERIPLIWLKSKQTNAVNFPYSDPYNYLEIDGLTGRVRVEQPRVE